MEKLLREASEFNKFSYVICHIRLMQHLLEASVVGVSSLEVNEK